MKESREKYWSELNQDEKIERMRRIVKNQGREVEELKEKVRKLRKHSHMNNGEIVVKFDADEPKFYPGKAHHPDEEYF